MKKSKVRALLAEMMGWTLTELTYYDGAGIPLGVCEVNEWKPDKYELQIIKCLDRWRELGEQFGVFLAADNTWVASSWYTNYSSKSFCKAVAVCLAKSWKQIKKENRTDEE